jgi:hypothetical protein
MQGEAATGKRGGFGWTHVLLCQQLSDASFGCAFVADAPTPWHVHRPVPRPQQKARVTDTPHTRKHPPPQNTHTATYFPPEVELAAAGAASQCRTDGCPRQVLTPQQARPASTPVCDAVTTTHTAWGTPAHVTLIGAALTHHRKQEQGAPASDWMHTHFRPASRVQD